MKNENQKHQDRGNLIVGIICLLIIVAGIIAMNW